MICKSILSSKVKCMTNDNEHDPHEPGVAVSTVQYNSTSSTTNQYFIPLAARGTHFNSDANPHLKLSCQIKQFILGLLDVYPYRDVSNIPARP